MSRWGRIYRVAWLALIALAAVGAAFLFMPRYHRFRQLQEEKSLLRNDNLLQEARIREFRDKQRRFETESEFVERMARERGWVKPDEKTFRVSAQADAAHPAP